MPVGTCSPETWESPTIVEAGNEIIDKNVVPTKGFRPLHQRGPAQRVRPVADLHPTQLRAEAEPLIHASLDRLDLPTLERSVTSRDGRRETHQQEPIGSRGAACDCLKMTFERLAPHRPACGRQ